MTLNELYYDSRDFLAVDDVADLLGWTPQHIRSQAHADKDKLGFPVIICGTRIKIPRLGFLAFCTGGMNNA